MITGGGSMEAANCGAQEAGGRSACCAEHPAGNSAPPAGSGAVDWPVSAARAAALVAARCCPSHDLRAAAVRRQEASCP